MGTHRVQLLETAQSFEVDAGYRLFEFSIEQATLGRRTDARAWPPSYTSWRAPMA